MATPAPQPTAGERLRTLMDAGCVAMPGAFNGLCARAVAKAGFTACYVSGAATSVCAGVPDIGVLTLEHFCRVIREVVDSSGLPVLADADTGFGEAEMLRRTVIEYARAGAAGLHIEDQVFPKRCGHLDGKDLIPLEDMRAKVKWAAKAARDTDTPGHRGFLVCARTDARGVEGFDAAVSRARAYVEAGAEMIFPEGLRSEEEFAAFADAMGPGKAARHASHAPQPTPKAPIGHATHPPAAHTPTRRQPYLLANMTEFGKTPLIPLSHFAAFGYSCVIFPVSLLRVAMGAVTRALEQLKHDGGVGAFQNQMQTREDLYRLIGYTPGVEWEWPVR
jgi:methylisocitrate lyase